MYHIEKKQPIAVFDSGVGGISVLRELTKIMPEEDFIYFGDSKNAPYGVKTKEEVRKLTIACATRLFDQGAKGLVVACNTATSAAVRVLREMYPYIPIVGIEPAVKPAVLCMDHPRVLVMATPMTIHEEKLHADWTKRDCFGKKSTLGILCFKTVLQMIRRLLCAEDYFKVHEFSKMVISRHLPFLSLEHIVKISIFKGCRVVP